MSVYIFFIEQHSFIQHHVYQKLMAKLSVSSQLKIKLYKHKVDKQSRLLGQHLLKYAINYFDLDPILLNGYSYTADNKPYLENCPLNFSIAHSDDMSVCAVSMSGEVGIDVERVKPVDLNLMADYFDPKIWQIIISSTDSTISFYQHWTRLEAAIKASGLGIPNIEMANIFIENNCLKIHNNLYHIHTQTMEINYIISVAAGFKIDPPVYIKISMSDLLPNS